MTKVALITGCAKGIGREISLELARDGYNIIGTYNTSLKEIENLKLKIDSIGVKFEFYKLDLRNEIEIKNFCNIIKDKYEKIDVLVNNAGLSFEVNLVAPFLLIQNLKQLLIDGIIINISSTDGINTYTKLNMDYSASKAGLINLTKSLALELENTRVYALCPNWVNTESIREMNQEYLKEELKRINQKNLIEPKEVAYKVINIIENEIPSGSVIVMEDSYDK